MLATVSVPLSLIDWYEMRLPRRLVLPLYPILLVLLGVATVVDHDVVDFVRATAGMVVLVIELSRHGNAVPRWDGGW